jgi:hypothetical protein
VKIKNLAIAIACGISFDHGTSVGDGELFKPARLGDPISIETREYRFSVTESGESSVVAGKSASGDSIKHELPHIWTNKIERLFALESQGCGGNSIDLVIQIGPGRNADVAKRIYYRIAFSRDLGRVIAEFYDPSVSATNAVLPIQSVEGAPDPDTGQMIICDGPKPSVKQSQRP